MQFETKSALEKFCEEIRGGHESLCKQKVNDFINCHKPMS